MTTNAMLLDKYIDFLVKKNFHIAISLDGDENSQSYRVDQFGNNSFHKVIDNVNLLMRNYPEYFKEQVSFMSVLHNRNDVEPILHFFKTHFNKVPQIAMLDSSGISEEKKEEFLKMFQNMWQSLYKTTNCKAIENEYFLSMPKGLLLSRLLYNTSGNVFYNYNQLLMNNLGYKKIFTGTCTPFSKKLFLATDGKILPCERIEHDFEMGYVHDDNVELDYKHVADLHNHYTSKCASQCISCATNNFFFFFVYHMDDIRSKSSICPEFCT
jgi:uncharacterized protein